MSVNDTNSDYSPLDPATWPLPAASGRILGIDVGMHADHSALALAGVWGALMGVVRVKQFALGTPLEMVADEVAKVARENRATIVVDASNNAAFVGMLAARLPQPAVNHLTAVTITGAAAHASQPTPMAIAIGGLRSAVSRWTLSKSELIETIGAEMGASLLRFCACGRLGSVAGRVGVNGAHGKGVGFGRLFGAGRQAR